MPDAPTPGEIAYTAWWRTRWPLDSPPNPTPYAQIPPADQRAWEAAAQAVRGDMPDWRFPLGQAVCWQEAPGAVWRIVARQRYEDTTGWWHTYALIPAAEPAQSDFRALTAYESELARHDAEEEPRSHSMAETPTPGQVAYEAAWRVHQELYPKAHRVPWRQLHQAHKHAWEAAAQAVLRHARPPTILDLYEAMGEVEIPREEDADHA